MMSSSVIRYSNYGCVCLSLFFLCATGLLWLRAQPPVNTNDVLLPMAISFESISHNTVTTPVAVSSYDVGTTTVVSSSVVATESLSTSSDTVVSIPMVFRLAVPFTSQAPEKNWDQPWQDACEEAAILMVDAYYRGYGLTSLFAKDEILKMLAYEEQFGWGGSIEIEKIQQTADAWMREAGIRSRIIENPTIEELKEYIAKGNPVLAVADGKILPNPHFQNGGPEYHALVILGYTETHFITNDPGTQFGENFIYAYDDLMNALRDWNGGDVPSGRQVVLVFEKQ